MTFSNNSKACKRSDSRIASKAAKSKRTRCQSENAAMKFGADIDEPMELLGITLEQDTMQRFAPALPPAPYPVEPYHFQCTRMSTECTVQYLSDTLHECDVEFTVQPNRCKFKCVKYVQYHLLEFVIRIYSYADALLVEFQRRGGCLLLWDHLYRTIYTKLLPWIDRAAPACSQSSKGQKKIMSQDSFSAVLHKTLFDSKYECSTKSSGMQVLEIMVISNLRDIQREGCKAIASITQDKENASMVFGRNNMMEAILACASSSDVEMASGAMAALRNIVGAMLDTKEESAMGLLVKRVIETSRIRLENRTDSSQLLRQCSMTLAFLHARRMDSSPSEISWIGTDKRVLGSKPQDFYYKIDCI